MWQYTVFLINLHFRIHHVCHGVLFKQISAWMLHGMLLDKYGEFFIQRTEKSKPGEGPSDNDADDIGLSQLSGQFVKQMLVCFQNFFEFV